MIEVLLLQGDSEIQTYTLVDMNPKCSDDYPDLERSWGLVVSAESEGNKMRHYSWMGFPGGTSG